MKKSWLVILIAVLLLFVAVQVVFAMIGLTFRVLWELLSHWYIVLPLLVVVYYFLGGEQKKRARFKLGQRDKTIHADYEVIDEDDKK